nr:MAG TPA: hypothetical protein [Caudoviricetes sp.]
MADRVNSLLADLKRLKVETGSLACMGCEREHNCGVQGCAVLREAADVLQEYVDRCARYADKVMALQGRCRWISVTELLPERVSACWRQEMVCLSANRTSASRVCGGATTEHCGFCWAAHPSPTGCRCRMRRR